MGKQRPPHVPTDLTWCDLVYEVDVKNAETKQVEPKQLLKGVSGTARHSRALAVMGPSGAGKSTFLNAVSGRLQVNKELRLRGTAFLNNTVLSRDLKPLLSFVAQDDIVMGKDTVREALTFSYRMRSGESAEDAEEAVNEMLQRLSLTNCADTLLGLPGLLKGVSGGEKKRTNIGSELINDPMILLLDEPTTGLDSVNALRVGQLIQELAHEEQRTVICTIHTPSSELFAVFDDLLLFAKGSTIYHGPREDAVAYFARLGYPVPHRMNPAEHYMKVLQSDSPVLEKLAGKWLEYCASSESESNLSINQTPAPENVTRASPGLTALAKQAKGASGGLELLLLTQRSWRVTMRDPGATFGKLIQTLFFATLLSLLFANLGLTDAGVTDRAGVLFMFVMMHTFMNVMNALATFAPERAVFMQEQSNSSYSAALYYLSKVVAELPISLVLPTVFVIITYFSLDLAVSATAFFNHLAIALLLSYCGNAFGLFSASLFPKPEIGMTITPVMLMPMFIVGGLFANTERLEPYWVWLNYLSFPRYAYKAFMVNEFDHIDPLCPSGACRFRSGQEALRFYGFDKDTDAVWFNAVIMIVLMLAFRVLGALALHVQGSARRSNIVFGDNYEKQARYLDQAGLDVEVPKANDVPVEMAPVRPPTEEEPANEVDGNQQEEGAVLNAELQS